MADESAGLSRLSLNQITTEKRTLEETVEACARAGIQWLGAWRHKIQPDPNRAAKIIRDAGMQVSSLCRGGFFPAATPEERRKRIDDNRCAIDEAATLGTDLLVLVCGPAPNRDLAAARGMVVDGIAEIESYAHDCGVRLGIEPLHPMYAAERSVIVTLEQANLIASQFAAERVGVVVDVFHVWWDPKVYEGIAQAGPRILGFHVSDWIVPLPDILMGRGMMGKGAIELRRLRAAVELAGFRGPIEIEIFNDKVWSTPLEALLQEIRQSFAESV
jgi:sugar phosphate isomerase/epimerase